MMVTPVTASPARMGHARGAARRAPPRVGGGRGGGEAGGRCPPPDRRAPGGLRGSGARRRARRWRRWASGWSDEERARAAALPRLALELAPAREVEVALVA